MMFSPFPRFLRSTPMKLFDLRVPRETAFTIINHLGQLALIHFLDSSPETPQYSRPYFRYVHRCEKLLMNLDDIKEIMKKFGKEPKKPTNYSNFMGDLRGYLLAKKKTEGAYFEEVETEIFETEEKLRNQLDIYEDFIVKCNKTHEKKVSLQHGKKLLGENLLIRNQELGFESEANKNYTIFYWVGMVNKEEMPRFKRMIFRASKGNALVFGENLLKNENPVDPKTLKEKEMSFYLLMFRGGSHDSMKDKMLKLIESFGIRKFEFPSNPEDFQREMDEVEASFAEFTETLNLTKAHIHEIISFLENPRFSSCGILEEHRLFMLKQKYIYTVLNQFTDDGDIIKIKCWCAESNESAVKEGLISIAKAESHPTIAEFIHLEDLEKNKTPPSHFQANTFLSPFQEIVNTYGIPRYQEINPGLFTIISFPFLFGVMFGDIGHGLSLLLFGLFLSLCGDKLKGLAEIRYLILLMGFFSVFCGLIYNEIFSIHLNLFGSCYSKSEKTASRNEDCVYVFGIDPIWGVASNELAFYNSFKMKLAVIIGVAQMTLGIVLKGFNALRFKNYKDLVFEVIPQLVFMSVTFVYLDIMIIVKWTTDWDHSDVTPPSIIELFLNLGLKMGGVESEPLYGKGHLQELIQRSLFICAFSSVPWMLVLKPLYIYAFSKKNLEKAERESYDYELDLKVKSDEEKDIQSPDVKLKNATELDERKTMEEKDEVKNEDEEKRVEDENEEDTFIKKEEEKKPEKIVKREPVHSINDSDSECEKREPMSEIIVHQIIETIEFVLGSISNTASYLRLWALSLAHSQLSKVFFEKTILDAAQQKSTIGLIVGYFLFVNVTFAVLMCMDVMECFLHALRLHWVEFQNKFYKADGYKFVPMSFNELYRSESHA